MPTRVFVNILQARSLPVMDRSTGLCDAYVKPQLKGVTFEPVQTQTARKTLNPVWNEQLKCDVTDDCLLQDEPLQLRIFDYDVLSSDDVIGTVYVHCNSLYEGDRDERNKTRRPEDQQKRQIFGWYPIYDTLRGICGELQVKLYIQHIMDFNPVEDSSVGVSVLAGSLPPDNFYIAELHGLVDELVVEDDPEYDWQDNFRSSRTSNDARQLLLLVMDGRLRRQIGRKVTDCGGNALLGYQTQFDLEDNFIIARGIGTAVTLQLMSERESERERERDMAARELETQREREILSAPPVTIAHVANAASYSIPYSSSPPSEIEYRSLEAADGHAGADAAPHEHASEVGEPLSASRAAAALSAVSTNANVSSPSENGKVNRLELLEGERERDLWEERCNGNSINGGGGGGSLEDPHGEKSFDDCGPSDRGIAIEREEEIEPVPQAQLRTLHRSKREHFRANLRLQDVQVVSMQEFPPGMLIGVGGMVAARSVKVVGQEGKQERAVEVRDSWWNELREEIKTHARSLDCCHVIGYTETTSITEEGVCVLCATGTAAVLDTTWTQRKVAVQFNVGSHSPRGDGGEQMFRRALGGYGRKVSACGLCHIPYSHRSPPFSMRLVLCNICGRKYVPDVLLATVELPHEAAVQGPGQLLEVHVCRALPQERRGVESSATRISELMPFIEYDLHKNIMSKLKIRCQNAVFGLRSQLSVSDGLVTCMTTGTSVLLGALPIPQPIIISRADQDPMSGGVGSRPRDARQEGGALAQRLMQLSETNRKVSQDLREVAADLGLARRTGGDSSSSSSDDASSSSSDDSDESRDRPSYVLEISDDQGESDMVALLVLEEDASGFALGACTTGRMLVPPQQALPVLDNLRLLTLFRRVSISADSKSLGPLIAGMFQEMLLTLSFRLRAHAQAGALLCGVRTHLSHPEDNMVQLGIVAMSLTPQALDLPASPRSVLRRRTSSAPSTSMSVSLDSRDLSDAGALDAGEVVGTSGGEGCGRDRSGSNATAGSDSAGLRRDSLKREAHLSGADGEERMTRRTSEEGRGVFEYSLERGDSVGVLHTPDLSSQVELTNLAFIPGTRVLYHIDRVCVCMIREVLRQQEPDANMSMWMSRLLLEGQAMCRAQAAAMGGNAVLHYNVQQCVVNNLPAKQRVYSLLIISGDAVCVTRNRSPSRLR